MGTVVKIINAVFYPFFLPFEGMRPDYALLIISAVTGVAMLYLYKWTSDQERLRAVQDAIKAHILEIGLYKTDLGVMARSLIRAFVKNIVYLWLLLPPALLLIALVVVIVVQCYPRFQHSPARPGKGVLVKAVLRDWSPDAAASVSLNAPAGVEITGGPLAVPAKKEMDWRVVPASPGSYELTFGLGEQKLTRTLVSGDGLVGVSLDKAAFSIGGYIENPMEVPLDPGSAFESLTINYPERRMDQPLLLGMNWIVYFFVVSFIVALAWKLAARVH